MMNNQSSVSAPRRRGRGCLLWLGRVALVVLGLIVFGAIYESAAEASDERAYPPPGQMIDMGSYRLHLNCTGTGSPVVVIDAGLGDWSTMWSLVQPEVAKTTRVCTYDRAGSGWSEAGPLPRNAETFARELHTLLAKGNIPGPYVLVGHSMGGFTMRVFAHDFPADVAGLVLIESMSPEQMTSAPTTNPTPTTTPSSGVSIPALIARVGIIRLLAQPLGLEVPLAPDATKAHVAFSVTPRSVQAFLDESEGMVYSGAQAKAVTTLGDLPLIVLTARLNTQQNWQTQQADLLQLSSHSQQLFAEKSGHNIELEQPDAAVEAIAQMTTAIRSLRP